MTDHRMPAAFLGHGNPMNALEHNKYTEAWRVFGESVPRPRAILVMSAHWYTNATAVTAMPRPAHHPRLLRVSAGTVRRAVPGARVARAGRAGGRRGETDVGGPDIDSWGIDHGTWSVLLHAFPDASIPVVQLSLNAFKDFDHHLELGRKLGALRDQGVLVIGSGNVVHNLRAVDYRQRDTGYDWATRFDEVAREGAETAPDRGGVARRPSGLRASCSHPGPLPAAAVHRRPRRR